MIVRYLSRFNKDIDKLNNKQIAEKLIKIISEIKNSNSTKGIKNIKKLKGHKIAYRIKIKNYRLCLFVENDIVELVRLLSRKDVYKYFPS